MLVAELKIRAALARTEGKWFGDPADAVELPEAPAPANAIAGPEAGKQGNT